MTQRKRRRDPEVVSRIKELTVDGLGPAAIAERLANEYPLDRQPSLRKINDVRTELDADPGEPWTLFEATAAEAELVPLVLATVIEATLGETRRLTKAEAAAIVRIRLAAPRMDPWVVYNVARYYVAGVDEADLDAYVAFDPTDPENDYAAAARYAEARPGRHLNLNYERADEALRAGLRLRQEEASDGS